MSNFHIQQANAAKVMALMRSKLEAQGFTFGEGAMHDSVEPPKGMGSFAVMERMEKAQREAMEEAARPTLGIVPRGD